jgi:outer membrane protein OmpA-like peptidoglycan-associated protein
MPGGFGASDLYRVSVNEDGSFGTPENLGGSINTVGKELFPSVDSNGTLYFASNGHMGLGGLDVFKAAAQNGGFGAVENLGTGANSAGDDFAFIFNPETESGFVSSNREGGKGMDDIYMVTPKIPPCDVIIDVLVVNAYTDEPLFGARVSLGDGNSERLSTIQTSESGTGQLMAACDTPLTVSAQYAGFEPSTIDIPASGNGSMNKTLKLKPVEAIIVDDKIELETILFDYNKSDIKPQAAFELDRLIEIMNKYPKLIVRVESHSDTQGEADYNRALSDRRAKATVQYVIDQGIDASRISGQGFGEDQPVVDCGDNCTEEDHEKNRRSEFIIVNE